MRYPSPEIDLRHIYKPRLLPALPVDVVVDALVVPPGVDWLAEAVVFSVVVVVPLVFSVVVVVPLVFSVVVVVPLVVDFVVLGGTVGGLK